MDNHPFRGPCSYEQDGVVCGTDQDNPIHYNWAVEEQATQVEQPPAGTSLADFQENQ